jgi:putative sterol carrier protein
LSVAADPLTEALTGFAARINEDARLRQMISDWDRTVRCVATDSGRVAGLKVEASQVSVTGGGEAEDILLEAVEPLLVGMFSGEVSPTEPYMDGRLRVRGTQEDVLRLDFLSLMIWGE